MYGTLRRKMYGNDQWKFQDPKMEVLYHIRPYCVVILYSLTLASKRGLIYGRYLQFRILKFPLKWWRNCWSGFLVKMSKPGLEGRCQFCCKSPLQPGFSWKVQMRFSRGRGGRGAAFEGTLTKKLTNIWDNVPQWLGFFFQKIEATNKIGFNKPFRTCICPKMGCHQKCHLNWEKHDVLILWDSGYHKSRILELRVHGNTELCQICGSGCVATLNPGRQPAGPGDQHFPTAFQPGYSYNSRCWVNAVLRSLLHKFRRHPCPLRFDLLA